MTTHSVHQNLEMILQHNAEDLLRFFLRRLEREDSADALAEVMTTAWKRVEQVPASPDQARMWLFGIARNTLMHVQRGNNRRFRLANRLRRVTTERTAPPPEQGLEIRDAIDRLDDDLAELVRLVYWEGFTLAEAACITGRTASTVRNQHQRAKKNLRVILNLEPSEPLAMETSG